MVDVLEPFKVNAQTVKGPLRYHITDDPTIPGNVLIWPVKISEGHKKISISYTQFIKNNIRPVPQNEIDLYRDQE